MLVLFDVGLIQWLQSFSSGVLDAFFLAITALGSHYVYMLILPFIYWAIDRKVGRRLAGLFLTSMWVNGLVKEFLTLPRPNPELVRVLGNEPSPGFPSGHAQGAMTLWGYLAIAFQRKWLTWVCVGLILLISISRLYLGVHFPGDVLGGLAIGAVLILAFQWLSGRNFGSRMSMRMKMLWSLVIPMVLYPLYQTGTSEQLIGFFIGFFTADLLAGEVIPYKERVPLKQQVLKLLIGYVGFVVLIVLHSLFVPVGLPSVFGYSLIAIWVALLAPALFRKLGLAGDAKVPRLDATISHNLRHYTWTAVAVLVLVLGSSAYVRLAIPPVAQPAMMTSSDMLVIAHAGGAGLAPGNTMAAFENAYALGVDVLEMDIRRTQDGQVVVIHDATVNRTTNGTGRVADMTLAELQTLDAGYRFTPDGGQTYPWRGRGVVVPTLEQVLTSFPDSVFLIELKESDTSFVPEVLGVLDAAGARHKVMLASFHDPVIQEIRKLAPDIPTSYAQGEVVRLVVMQRLGLAAFVKPQAAAMQVPERQGPIRVVDPGLRRIVRDNGMQIHVWTVNDEEAMHRLIALGVDGIITDYPNRLFHVKEVLEGRNMEQVFY